VEISQITYSTQTIPEVTTLSGLHKNTVDSLKIVKMNSRIQEWNMYWRAGKIALSELTYPEKEMKFGRKMNLQGMDYLKGGIFQRKYETYTPSEISEFISQFDWRDRHHSDDIETPYYNSNGWGWITIEHHTQGIFNTCWAFASTGLAECYANLYFNNNAGPNYLYHPEIKHQVDINLSEQQIINCLNGGSYICLTGPYNTWVFPFFNGNYIVEDGCNPYSCPSPGSIICPTPPCSIDAIKLEGSSQIGLTGGQGINAEVLQTALINYGPIDCQVADFYQQGMDHNMILVGYGVVDIGDTVYKGTGENDPSIILDQNCPFLNGIYYYFKNSDFNDIQGYPESILTQIRPLESKFFYGPIERSLNPTTILCSDEDKDGYYWWGIHWKLGPNNSLIKADPSVDCGCPPGVRAEDEDCDDWDVTLGPYNETGPDPLYTCKPNPCETQNNDPLIINDLTPPSERYWGENKYIDRNIIIRNTTLSIHAEVFFSPGAKIIVMPGARLVLQGNQQFPARLSSGCGQLWGGIEVHGDPKARQVIVDGIDENHGIVYILNGIIENTVCGIRVANQMYDPNDYSEQAIDLYYPSGGIIQANLATFSNNQTGVLFYPYRNFDENGLSKADESSFLGCTFETIATLLNQSAPGYLLKLNGVNGIKLVGCTFKNKNYQPAPLGPDYPYRGRGIYCYNSDLYLHDTTGVASIFECLEYGVYAMHSGLNSSWVSLKNTTFNGNQCGAYFSGYSEINPVDIDHNDFNHSQNRTTINPQETKLYGLYLNNCSGYKVSLNTFNGSDFSGEGILYGALINNSGARSNFIYNNDFENLDYGLQSQNRNRGKAYLPDKLIGGTVVYPVETGLCFKCNDFTGCEKDIVIVADEPNPPGGSGIVKNQGTDLGYNSQTAAKEPAGNTFSPAPWISHNDINISNSVENIIYLHHHHNDFHRVIPDKEDHINKPDKVTLQEHSSPAAIYQPSASCPDDEYPGFDLMELKCKIDEARVKIDSLSNLLYLLIDEGSTDDKNETVLSSTPGQSFELYQDLLGTSPYLSDTVLKSAIAREEVLPNVMISDIIVSNPQAAKSEDIITALEERVVPLSDSAWNEIMKGVDTVAARERLEAELSGWIAAKERCMNEILAMCMADSNRQWGPDSLVSLLTLDPILSSQYKLVNYFIDTKDYYAAGDLLLAIPEHFLPDDEGLQTNAGYLALLPLLEQLHYDTSGFIVPDSVQQVILSEIALLDHEFPGAMARNILISCGLIEYREPVLTPSSLKSGKHDHHRISTNATDEILKVYPNPCRSYATVEYKINATSFRSLRVSLLNFENRVLLTRQLTKLVDNFILPLKGLNPGIYLVRLEKDGKYIETQKLVVIQ